MLPGSTQAATTGYTDSTAFQAALGGPSATGDFDLLTPGASIPSASQAEGIVWTYSLDGESVLVTDTHDAPSPTNQLGLSGGDDALLDGDVLTLGFPTPKTAVGLRIVTSDATVASEIQLATVGGSIGNSVTPQQTLADGGLVYFVGLISETPFTTATLSFAADGEINFVYNMDDVVTAALVADTDGDGLSDADETGIHGTDPNDADSDDDGLNDGDEVNTYGTNPLAADTDGDTLLDGFEVANSFNPLVSGEETGDPDADGLDNLGEQTAGTDPGNPDTDGDGLNDGDELATVFGARVIEVEGAQDAHAADIDGDTDMDIARVATGSGSGFSAVAWFENADGVAGSFTEHGLATAFANSVWSVRAADLDGDTDLDIVAYGYNGSTFSRVVWYENTDGAGTFAFPVIVDDLSTPNFEGSVEAADLDGDTDLDLIVAEPDSNSVHWYANTDGNGSFGSRQTITTTAVEADAVVVADVDGDTDLDVVVGADGLDGLEWYENLGSGSFGSEQTIDTLSSNTLTQISVADVDGDTDLDIVIPAAGAKVAWYENTDGAGSFSAQQEIDTIGPGQTQAALAVDVDGDSDVDVVASDGAGIYWYENTDGSGSFGARQTLQGSSGSNFLDAADLNGDGDLDIVAGSLAWWEQTQQADPLVPDTDGDGLSDGVEVNTHGTYPFDADTDDDGLSDGDELNTYLTDPLDTDSDDDGLSDGDEVNTHGTDPLDADTDGDNLEDGDEVLVWLSDPLDTDTDGDGLTDDEINVYGSSPTDTDSDNDGLDDGAEVLTHGTDPGSFDTDGDGLSDGAEVNTHLTDPLDADSDDDGFSDGVEIAAGSDPNDGGSTPLPASVPALGRGAQGVLVLLLGVLVALRIGGSGRQGRTSGPGHTV